MHERPIGDLVDALRALGADMRYSGAEGFPPLAIAPGDDSCRRNVAMRGDVSSQFLTALLMALPLAGGGSDGRGRGRADLQALRRDHAEADAALRRRCRARRLEALSRSCGRKRTQVPGTVVVEGDASSASYFLAAGAIGGGPVRVEGVGRDSIQGDVAFADTLAAMGAIVRAGDDWIEVRGKRAAQGNRCRLQRHSRCRDDRCGRRALRRRSDDACAISAAGASRRPIASRRWRPSCRKLGAVVEEGPDWLRIDPPQRLRPATIDTYDDHRMAMCFSLAALGGVTVRINDPRLRAQDLSRLFRGVSTSGASIMKSSAPGDAPASSTQRVQPERSGVPLIAIDGPAASGKGTVAQGVARALRFHYLDSGSLYRLVGAGGAARRNLARRRAGLAGVASLAGRRV